MVNTHFIDFHMKDGALADPLFVIEVTKDLKTCFHWCLYDTDFTDDELEILMEKIKKEYLRIGKLMISHKKDGKY